MKMKKRSLIMVLMLSLIVTLVPAIAFADEDIDALHNEISEEQVTVAEEVLTAEGQIVTYEETILAEEPVVEINDKTLTYSYFSDVTYTGKAVRPEVTIEVNGVSLVEGADYTVTCRNNKKIGKATIIITGCGRYSGSITRTFNIVPKGCSLKSCKSKKGSGQCTVRWKKGSKGCSGYIVRYSTDPNFGSYKTKRIKGINKTSCTLSKLTKGTTYYVQVCVYKKVKKTRYCSAWSNCSSFVTKGVSGTSDLYTYRCIKQGNYIYCGVRNNLVRVNLKTKKVKTIATGHSEYLGTTDLSVRNGYIYFVSYDGEDFTYASLYRVDMNGNNMKVLYAGDSGQNNDRLLTYFIKNNKLYYLVEADSDKHAWVAPWAGYSMNLDGSDLKLDADLESVDDWDVYRNIYSNYERYHKQCNVKGYKVIEEWVEKNENIVTAKVWIKTPKGKIIKAGTFVF